MYAGQVVEGGPTGQVPDLRALGRECRFRSRCAFAAEVCRQQIPMFDIAPGRRSRCIHDGTLLGDLP